MSRDHADSIVEANQLLLERGDADAIPRFFAPSYVVHGTGRDARGHAMIRRFLGEVRGAFHELRVTVEVLATDGDCVAWQRTCRATHGGDFKGFPATGRAVAWRDMLVSRFEDGLIAEEWAVSDLAEHLLRAAKGSAG